MDKKTKDSQPKDKLSRDSQDSKSHSGKNSTDNKKLESNNKANEKADFSHPKPKASAVPPSKESLSSEKDSEKSNKNSIKLSGIYAFKLAMSSLYDEKGQFVPVTFLEVKPWFVSQIKQKKKDGYNSVQVACMPQKNNRCSKALRTHLSSAGFSAGARYVREIRQDSVDNIEVGQSVSIHSIQKGDKVKLQSISKGHGFAGVVKRWGFKGGPASHGSKTHRSSGSIGNRTEPARVMPGKKMAGHYGVEKVSLKDVQVMDVISDEKLHLHRSGLKASDLKAGQRNGKGHEDIKKSYPLGIIVVRGPVPGARNSLVFLSKQV